MSSPALSKEPIQWDSDKQKAVQGTKPVAKYGKASESLRHSVSQQNACKLGCHGKKCKYESATYWKEEEQAIKGVFSHWVTDNILAMARPNTEGIEKHDIIGQFKKCGICSIINLQLPGEHSFCGNPLEPMGFSYKPQQFMDSDVFFYNFGWPDYGVGSLSNILDMVKVMQFAVSEGKVAIHCHAGLGRTGVMIATYLVYTNRMDPDDAIHYCRSKRTGMLQTRSQIQCVNEFAQYLVPLRVVFSTHSKKTYDFTLAQFLIRQKHVLHGYEARRLKLIPKIIYVCCERLMELGHRGHRHHQHRNSVSLMIKTAPSAFNNRCLQRSTSTLESTELRPLKQKSVSLESFTPLFGSLRVSRGGGKTNSSQSSSSEAGEVSDSELSVDTALQGSEQDFQKAVISRDRVMGSSAEMVAHDLSLADYDKEVKEKIQEYKVAVNTECGAWEQLMQEKQAAVLAGLMWDWIDHLREPILHAQDLPNMLEYADDPLAGLQILAKGESATLEYLFKSLARLAPLPDDLQFTMLERALSTLTQQNIVLEADQIMVEERHLVKRTCNNSGLMRGALAQRIMNYFQRLVHAQRQAMEREHREQEGRATEERNNERNRGKQQQQEHTQERKKKQLNPLPTEATQSAGPRRQGTVEEEDEEEEESDEETDSDGD